jgi:hypothetical protein
LSGGRPRRRGTWVLLAVLALLLVAAVGYLALRDGTGGSNDTANDSPTGSSTGSSTGSPSGSASRSPSSSPSAGASGSSPSSGSAAGGSQEAFLRDYYAAAPGGTDEGWSRLGPGEKAQGRASYDGFWRTIRSVDVADVRPLDQDSVEVTLTYHKRDGGTSRERQQVDLVRSSDGGYLINGDQPAG